MTDPYASEEETRELLFADTRTPEQKKADELADKNWMNEQGTEPQRTWVGLTADEVDVGLVRSNHAFQMAGAWRDGVEWASKQLKEKNT